MECIRCGTPFEADEEICPACRWNRANTLDELAGFQIGEQIFGRYEVMGSMGVGRLGAVLQVEDHKEQSQAVIKFIHPALIPDKVTQRRFLNELRGLVHFSHRRSTEIYDVGVDGSERCYVAREFLGGESLRNVMDKRRIAHELFSFNEVLTVFENIIDLYRDVAGVVHGSLAPQKIRIVAGDGLKITDVGIAACLPPQAVWYQLSRSPRFKGFTPPEFEGGELPTPSTDVYCLAAIVGEMMTQVPFNGQPSVYRQHGMDASEEIGSILEQALQPDPNQRFESPLELFEELRSVETRSWNRRPRVPKKDSDYVSDSPTMPLAPVRPMMPQPKTIPARSPVPAKVEPVFADNTRDSMAEVIRAHTDEENINTPAHGLHKQPNKVISRDSRIGPKRPSRPTPYSRPPRPPSFVPPPVQRRADDPASNEIDLSLGMTRREKRSTNKITPVKSITETLELDVSEIELEDQDREKTDPTMEIEPEMIEEVRTDTAGEAATKLEALAEQAERESAKELIRRAGRLEGVDPRLVRAAHSLESDRRGGNSRQAAELIRKRAEELKGIDPRLLRAAARLEQARVGGPPKKTTENGEEEKTPSPSEKEDWREQFSNSSEEDSVISFLAPPVVERPGDLRGFPENRKQAVKKQNQAEPTPPPPPPAKRR